ncbi:hypothetical protein ExPUPEC61_02329 [Escherichia coli]|nr:hypothetical protein HmCmsJML274_04540 [Escherichia coli]GDU52326.1 hypothetical protein ExPUPEC61_02329 [Escherichia coli]
MSGKTGIDSHDRNFISLMDIVFHGLNRRFRIKNQPHFHAMTADFINQAECLTVDSFRMQSDEISSRTCQLSNVILRTRYHQMAVERFTRQFFYLAYEER